MIYLHPGSNDISRLPPWWGTIVSPRRWTVGLTPGRPWCLDNDAFSVGGFDPGLFFNYLERAKRFRRWCLFVTVPDVVGNAIATLESYRWWAWRIKALGWPVAFVAQDGQESLPLPPEFDALFIGGSTEWKMGEMADSCIRRAKAIGKWVHAGRVNSQRRIRHFQLAGVDSVDGTAICFGPDANLPRLNRQLAQRPLFTLLNA